MEKSFNLARIENGSGFFMQEKEKTYNGFWKQIGCTLSIIAILGILAVIIIGFYMLLSGF
ncbi:hypothetical protein AAY42_04205 [Flagellimonas eckloniae]|uniref:Uncharacterized protein n=1 Tax=Flagellimonas eckloniae TaxID=346185 RepID=A0A0Q1DK34_9FLAO|nr:hypothetical protein AAY42_04205 [Allomuricauda eckloniae]